jgi:hypothetical protein
VGFVGGPGGMHETDVCCCIMLQKCGSTELDHSKHGATICTGMVEVYTVQRYPVIAVLARQRSQAPTSNLADRSLNFWLLMVLMGEV